MSSRAEASRTRRRRVGMPGPAAAGRPPSHARPGFVLMEAVVALAIIALFAIALLGAVGAQVRTAAKGNVLLVARPLAEERVETLRMFGYEELRALPDSLTAGVFPPPFEAYRWQVDIVEAGDEYDLFGVQVTVHGNGEAYPLRTLLHRPRPLLQAAQ